MKESSFKAWFLTKLKKELTNRKVNHDIICIESPVIRGVPDVNYNIGGTSGWMEFKYLPAWPKRKNTYIRLREYTIQQYAFLTKRAELHESAHLIIRIEDDIIIRSRKAIFHPDAKFTKDELVLSSSEEGYDASFCSISQLAWDKIIYTVTI